MTLPKRLKKEKGTALFLRKFEIWSALFFCYPVRRARLCKAFPPRSLGERYCRCNFEEYLFLGCCFYCNTYFHSFAIVLKIEPNRSILIKRSISSRRLSERYGRRAFKRAFWLESSIVEPCLLSEKSEIILGIFERIEEMSFVSEVEILFDVLPEI